jgi:hypothetical protein
MSIKDTVPIREAYALSVEIAEAVVLWMQRAMQLILQRVGRIAQRLGFSRRPKLIPVRARLDETSRAAEANSSNNTRAETIR